MVHRKKALKSHKTQGKANSPQDHEDARLAGQQSLPSARKLGPGVRQSETTQRLGSIQHSTSTRGQKTVIEDMDGDEKGAFQSEDEGEDSQEENYTARDLGCVQSVDAGMDNGFSEYYAVAVGRKPGIYSHWDEAKAQIQSFPNCKHGRFMDRSSAVRFMLANGIPETKIRLFRKSFKPAPNFTPNPLASFNDEFAAFAGSQDWGSVESRKAKIIVMVTDFISRYLPEGILPDQEYEDGEVDLADDQMLQIYQGMCQSVSKPVHTTINNCLLELKRAPFTNILDFLDAFRSKKVVKTFPDWDRFVDYTFNGRRIDIEYARENEFLAPLLQDLRRGPSAVDPIETRERFQARNAHRRRERMKKLLAARLEASSSAAEVNLSPPASEFSSSRSPTPDLVYSTPFSSHGHNQSSDLDNKRKPPGKALLPASTRPEAYIVVGPATPTEYWKRSFSQEPPPSSQMEERHWSTAPVLGKRTCISSSEVNVIVKRGKRSKLDVES